MADFPPGYENSILESIKDGNKSSFTLIFNHFYKDLVTFAFGFVHNLAVSEEIVQDVYLRLWENRKSLEIDRSLRSYLLKAVQNRCLNWLQHMKIRSVFTSYFESQQVLSENETEQYLLHSELEIRLNEVLGKMPPEASQCFRMNRFENMSYSEIAEKLGVSVRTIENRISKALSCLRKELKDFLILVLLVIRLF